MDPELRAAGAIALWCFPLQAVEPRAALGELNDDERARAETLPDAARTAFVAVRASLRRALEPFGIDPRAAFRYGAFGKPVLPEPCGVGFNVAHAGGWGAIAVGRARTIGLDIEAIDPALDAGALIERFFAPAERAELRSAGAAHARAFTTVWTRREAVLKAVGLGLGPRADAFSVTVPPDRPAVRLVDDPRFAGPFALHAFEIGATIVGTLAVGTEEVRVRRIDAPP